MEIAQESLNEVNTDAELLKRIITGSETWVYGYEVESKSQSSQLDTAKTEKGLTSAIEHEGYAHCVLRF